MRVVAGVDSSTQSTKVELRRLDDGAVVGRASAPHPVTTPPRSEQDPAAWLAAFQQAYASAASAAGAFELAGLSVAGQQHGMVTLDADGLVLRPAKLWNDTESADDAARLVAELAGPGVWASAVGSVPVAAFTITKLAWLRRTEPDAWSRLARVLLPHDWLTLQLTGQFVTDRGDASGTGYWSPAAETYRYDLLHEVDASLDWAPMVPRVAAPMEVVGEWNGAPVACGTGDNMAAALGLGLSTGVAAVSVGTSGTAYTVAERWTADPTGAVAGFADASGRFLPLVCTLNATKVIDAMARVLGVDHDQFDALADSLAPGSAQPVLLPYFDGERTPNLPGASGWITGLRTDVTREQLARATVDGVVCSLLDALDELRRHAPVHRIVLIGGGARSAALRAAFAGLADIPVGVVDAAEAVATGACVQAAAVASGESHAGVVERWSLGATTPVDPTHADRSLRERYAAVRQAAADAVE
jgi:xylulokinase